MTPLGALGVVRGLRLRMLRILLALVTCLGTTIREVLQAVAGIVYLRRPDVDEIKLVFRNRVTLGGHQKSSQVIRQADRMLYEHVGFARSGSVS